MSYRKEIAIAAPIDKVWDAWTSTAKVEKWLAPKANVVFAKGELYEFFWNDNPAIDSTLGCRLLEIDKNRKLVFEWQGKKEFIHMFEPPIGTPTVVTAEFFSNEAGTETAVRITQEETRDLDQWAAYDIWMAQAWQMALGSLKAYCEGVAAPPYWQS